MADKRDPLSVGWSTIYRLQLAELEEQGDIVVLGHHTDVRRVIAALNRHARTVWRARDLFDGYETSGVGASTLLALAVRSLSRKWARFITDCEDPVEHAREGGEDGACSCCAEIAEAEWWIIYGTVRPGDAGAFPITVWSPT